MYESKILGKAYKTKTALKSQLTRYKRLLESDLKDKRACKAKGWTTYLGEPILKQIVDLTWELRTVNREIAQL